MRALGVATRFLIQRPLLRSLVLIRGSFCFSRTQAVARFSSTTNDDGSESDGQEIVKPGDESDSQETVEGDSKDKPASGYDSYGLYKAVILGHVGFGPFEKVLGDGRALTLFSVGTSGLIRPANYPEIVQWHKVAVYPGRFREVAKQIRKGRRVYLEGNLEVRIFNDIVTGAVKRIREISVRRDGQLILLEEKDPPRKLTLPSLNYRRTAITNSPLDSCQEEEEDHFVLPR